jgi:hypothetical protein
VLLNNGASNLSETQIHSGSNSVGNVYIAAAAGSSTQIYIGNQTTNNTTTNMLGNTILSKPQINTLVATSATTAVNLYNTTTTNTITMGSGQTIGDMNIASGANRTGSLNLAQTTKGNISIGNGMQTGGTGLVTIGSTTVGNITLNSGTQLNIGTVGTGQITMGKTGANTIVTGNNTYLRANSTLNIGDTGSAGITIGNASSSLTINNPLTVGYVPSAITTTSQIGYTVADTIDFTGAYTSSTAGTFFTGYKTLPAGVWLIQFSSRVRSAGISTLTRWYFWGENSVDGSAPIQAYTSSSATTVIDTEGLSAAGTFTVTSNGSGGYNIFAYFVYTGSAVNIDKSAGFGSNVKRTRIA